MTDNELSCPACAAPIAAVDTFCEACGASLNGTAPPPELDVPSPPPTLDDTAPIPRTTTTVIGETCGACGAAILDDGFCGTCGRKAVSPRDHWTEQPAPWVAGVCDKGVLHARNEDAMALAATVDRPFAVLVVCDGVTSAPDSDRASLAASRSACDLLAAIQPSDGGTAAAVAHWTDALRGAADEAHASAVGVAHALGDPPEPPSCTFVATVVVDSLIATAWCGDSRAYWLPDGGEPVQLTVDHSLGTELIAAGKTPAEAELDPTFHTITRWLGADSADHTPEFSSHVIDRPGWVLVCSDGLWNYANELDEIAELVNELHALNGDPLQLAASLVDWANAAGGHDNITAALARCQPSLHLHNEGVARG
jgi:serine/threonine protein phosphatase PrpC